LTFFNLSHHKVSNYEISNLFEQNQNFAVNFQTHQKQNQKSTKYIKTE